LTSAIIPHPKAFVNSFLKNFLYFFSLPYNILSLPRDFYS
jgi:hypothetical protein